MASIREEIVIAAPAELVWDALRDVGAVHRRLAPGFVTATRLEGDTRLVTFANGVVARELIVDCDDRARRLAYAVQGGTARHHHARFQLHEEGPARCRLVWVADLLPAEAAGPIGAMMAGGAGVIRATLEAAARERG
jgi:carbon monoxide dehydrogenase subunit G